MDTYRAIAAQATAEIKRKGSRFLAEAFSVETVEAAEEQIAVVRKREHKATHHCTAYRVRAGGETFRYDDDTTPAGRVLDQFDAEIREEHYTAETELLVAVRRSEVEAFRAAFRDALWGDEEFVRW